jgi:hypothetical protein
MGIPPLTCSPFALGIISRIADTQAVWTTSGRLAVTLTVGGSCATDAARIGEWMVRAAIA